MVERRDKQREIFRLERKTNLRAERRWRIGRRLAFNIGLIGSYSGLEELSVEIATGLKPLQV